MLIRTTAVPVREDQGESRAMGDIAVVDDVDDILLQAGRQLCNLWQGATSVELHRSIHSKRLADVLVSCLSYVRHGKHTAE